MKGARNGKTALCGTRNKQHGGKRNGEEHPGVYPVIIPELCAKSPEHEGVETEENENG